MNKIIKIILLVSLLLIKTHISSNLIAMEDSRSKNIIFVISGQWDGSEDFQSEGIFYTELEKEVLSKNTKNPQTLIQIVPFHCEDSLDRGINSKKLEKAFLLANAIQEKIFSGVSHVSIFAHGDGIDIAALATQLLNNTKYDLAYKEKTPTRFRNDPIKPETIKSYKATLAMDRNLKNLQKQTSDIKLTNEPSRNFRAGNHGEYSINDRPSQKLITVITINPDPESPFNNLLEHDLDIVDFVHHVTPGNPSNSIKIGQEQNHFVNTQPSCMRRCFSCFCKTVHDPRTKALVSFCLKIAISLAIAAL